MAQLKIALLAFNNCSLITKATNQVRFTVFQIRYYIYSIYDYDCAYDCDGDCDCDYDHNYDYCPTTYKYYIINN